jgi:hypothetical protein
VNVVREDPKRKGLLFAGTEREVYVSFDDGDHWQSLRLNMPATSIRDLIIKDDDLALGTHSRGFWILDDITPLRQMTGGVTGSEAFLFAPERATRVRWDMNTDTPLPPDEPAGQNPPDGALIDYYVGPGTSGPVTLEILDGAGKLVRRYSSDDPVPPLDPMLAIPKYWVRPERALPAGAGLHRWVWDMHYTPLPGLGGYGMQAILHDTPRSIASLWVMPGRYTVKLTAGGKSFTQPLAVRMDPRVRTSVAGLERQFTMSKQLYEDAAKAAAAIGEIQAARKAGHGAEFDKQAAEIEGEPAGRFGRSGATVSGPDTLNAVAGTLRGLLGMLQEADVAPSPTQAALVAERRAVVAKLLERWTALQKTIK